MALGGFGGYLPPVVAVLDANIRAFEAKMAKARAEMNGTSSRAARAGRMVRTAFLGMGVAAAVVAVKAFNMANEFDTAMLKIHTQAGATGENIKSLEDKVLALAPAVGLGPMELAHGLFFVESAGFRGAKAMNVLKVAAMGAKVGEADLESVVRAMTATLKSKIKGVSNATQAMGVMNSIVGVGAMRMGDLTAAFSTGILPVAANAGITLQNLGAAIATMTEQGMGADEAATRLRMTISMMIAPTDKARKELKNLGLTKDSLAKQLRGPKGLLGAVQLLKKHLKDSGMNANEANAALTNIFGGGRTAAGIQTLMRMSGTFADKVKAIGTKGDEAARRFKKAWRETQQDVGFQLDSLKVAFTSAMTRVGLIILPIAGKVIRAVTRMVAPFAKSNKAARYFAYALGTVMVIAAALAVQAIVSVTIALATNPYVLAALAIVALAVAVKKAYDRFKIFRTVVNGIGHFLKNNWKQILLALVSPMAAVVWLIIKHWGSIKKAFAAGFRYVQSHWKAWLIGLAAAAVRLFARIGGAVAKGLARILSALGHFIGRFSPAWLKWLGRLVSAVITTLARIVSRYAGFFGRVITALVRFAAAFLGRVAKWLGSFYSRWVSALARLFTRIVRFYADVITAAARFIGHFLDRVRRFLGSVHDRFRSGLSRVLDRVKSWGSALGGRMLSIGRAVIGKLGRGLVAGAQAIGHWIKRLKDIVVDKVKSFFGISSPSKVFMNLGRHLTEGLVVGMAHVHPAKFIKKIFGGMTGALGATVGKGFIAVKNLSKKALNALGSLGGVALKGLGLKGIPGVGVGGNVGIVKAIASRVGWGSGAQWAALYRLIMGESGFRNNAQNPTSSAYGMFQFLNSTWAGTGVGKTSNPALQAIAGLRYISRAYGSPLNAYAKWAARSPHWYGRGSWEVQHDQIAGIHRGEMIVPRRVAEPMRRTFGASSGGSVTNITVNVAGHVLTERQLYDVVQRQANRRSLRNPSPGLGRRT